MEHNRQFFNNPLTKKTSMNKDNFSHPEFDKDNLFYRGWFKSGFKNGVGTEISKTGFRYIGLFENNLRHGKGVFETTMGVKYVGEYYNGLRHGTGTCLYED